MFQKSVEWGQITHQDRPEVVLNYTKKWPAVTANRIDFAIGIWVGHSIGKKFGLQLFESLSLRFPGAHHN
jgi:hypothetical protein